MDVKQELKFFFGEGPLFYIKFTREEQWAKDILQGKLFMNKLEYYRNLELNSGIKGQGDKGELKAKIVPIEMSIKSNETNIVIPLRAGRLEFELGEDKHKHIFCITGLTIDEMIIENYNESSVILRFPYIKNDIELLKSEFGKYVVILNSQRFETNIRETLDSSETGGIFGKFKYTVENSLERIQVFAKGSPERFMYKDLEFKHQKEYRLVLAENIDNNKVLSIGNLSDVGLIYELEEFLNFTISLNFR